MQRLEAQLAAVTDKMGQEKDAQKKLSEEITKLKSAASEARLDLRVSQRDLKQAQDTVAFLRERSKEHRAAMEEKEAALKAAQDASADLKSSVARLEADAALHQAKLEKLH